VRRVVVHDQMRVQLGRQVLVDPLQKIHVFSMAMAPPTLRDRQVRRRGTLMKLTLVCCLFFPDLLRAQEHHC
jgi:hypothetical protein